MKHLCSNCGESPLFPGWDNCLPCGVAISLVEQPEYLAWANRVYSDAAWLAQLNAEWERQSGAIAVPAIRMTVRQAS